MVSQHISLFFFPTFRILWLEVKLQRRPTDIFSVHDLQNDSWENFFSSIYSEKILSRSFIFKRKKLEYSSISINLHMQHQFSCSVVSSSLWYHGLQHTRPPCPSPTPGACSNSCSSSRWCHPTISLEAILHPNHKILFKLSCYKTVFALWVRVNNAILSFLELQAVEKR